MANLPAEAQTDVISPFAMALQVRNFVIEGMACQLPSSKEPQSLDPSIFVQDWHGFSIKNFYLAPDLKNIKPKKVANDQKINLAP